MAFKLIILSALVAYASAGVLAYPGVYPISAPLAYPGPPLYKTYHAAPVVAHAAPVAALPVAKAIDTEHDSYPQYSYSYDVADSLTGDFKAQSETRNGDVVTGQYSLVDADGTHRIVDYTADDVNGFNAVVRKEPLPARVALPAAAPVAYAAPAVAKVVAGPLPVAAPLAYHAPIAAPIAKIAYSY